MTRAYTPSGNAAPRNSTARSANIDTEFQAISDAFATLPASDDLVSGTAHYAPDTGSANALLVAMPTTATAYTDGMLVVVKALNTNTTTSTINVDGLGVKQIRRQTGSVLVAGDIVATSFYSMRYNGTYFVLSSFGNAEIETLAAISTDISTVAGISATVTSVNDNETNINAAVSNATNINAAVANETNIDAAVANATNINSAVSNATNINTVVTNIADVNAVGNNIANVIAVDGNETNINAVVANATNINAVVADATDIGTVVTNIADVNAVATNIANVIAVDGNSANINAVAANEANINAIVAISFEDIYLGPKASDPTLDNDGDALVAGALYFNTTTDLMMVYTGSAWTLAGSAVNGTVERQSYSATASQTTFAVTYDVGFVDVWLNGVKLLSGTDFTASSGSDIVLAVGATALDVVDILAFGSFNVSNTVAPSRVLTAGTGLTGGGDLSVDRTFAVDGTVALVANVAALTGATFSGEVVMADQLLTKPLLKDFGIEVNAHGATGATETLDIENGNYHTATVDEATTLTFSNPTATGDACIFYLELTNGGAFVVTWPAAVAWDVATAPTLQASGVDVLAFVTTDAGTTYRGFIVWAAA
jgi:hypothetical protein